MKPAPLTFFSSAAELGVSLSQTIGTGDDVFLLTDTHVAEHCLPELLAAMGETRAEIIEIEPGEESKCLSVCAHLYEHLAERRTMRNALLICIGGGVVTDLGGFVASTYKRGIRFLHIPTSLIGMADASIGGKTGIDLGAIKNVVGTFAQPVGIWIAPEFLKSLPEKEMWSGFAEMLKHALVADAEHWQTLYRVVESSEISSHIERSAQIKWRIVESDPLEKGQRKLLNFGHTFGHALESFRLASKEPQSHGACVAVGMMAETVLSEHATGLTSDHSGHILQVLYGYYSDSCRALPRFEQLSEYLQQDKKRNVPSSLNFSLLEAPGKGVTDCQTSPDIAREAWELFVQRVSTM